MLTADSKEVQEFLAAWHENGRARFEASYNNLVYDDYAPKTAINRRRFIALDEGKVCRSGRFLVERETGDVYSIKAYGVPNRKIGTIATLTAQYTK